MGNIEIGRIGNESLVVEDADNDGIYDAGETVGIRVESEARGDRVDRDYARVQQMMDRLGVSPIAVGRRLLPLQRFVEAVRTAERAAYDGDLQTLDRSIRDVAQAAPEAEMVFLERIRNLRTRGFMAWCEREALLSCDPLMENLRSYVREITYWNMEIPNEIIRRVFAYATLEFPEERFRARLVLDEEVRQLHHERGVVRSSDPPSIFCREEDITFMPIVTSAGEVFEVGERVRFVGGKQTRVITGFVLRGDPGEYAAVWADGTLSSVEILEHG